MTTKTNATPHWISLRNPIGNFLHILTMALLVNLAGLAMPTASAAWSFAPPDDPYTGEAILDLRRDLNEAEAGQSGYVRQENGRFLLGDGRPVRFLGANIGPWATLQTNRAQARLLAKRGINLVRSSGGVLLSNQAADPMSVAETTIDRLQQVVQANKEEGIYTLAIVFFILDLQVNPAWGWEGYTEEWFQNNPDKRSLQPFGLLFFSPQMQSVYRNWLRQLFTRPNPYHPTKKPLALDPAIAMIEIQNEDNLFFYTFRPANYPPEQRQRIHTLFGDWLKIRYGSLAAAQEAWLGRAHPEDDFVNGQAGVFDAYAMSADRNTRIRDQILFLGGVQYDFYEKMRLYLKETLGYEGLCIGSNWQTANGDFLNDLEHYTYTAAGVIDVHHYYNPWLGSQGSGIRLSGGDTFYHVPCVHEPRPMPSAYKQISGHPCILSEAAWNHPMPKMAEAPLLIGAYSALTDLGGFIYHRSSSPVWEQDGGRWMMNTPTLLGQFPGAALLYRRGDVATAPVMIHEGRRLETIAKGEKCIIKKIPGWDPGRDPLKEFKYDQTTGKGQIDPLAFYTGRVEMGFDTDADYVAPDLDQYMSATGNWVNAATGQVKLDMNRGLLTIDTPRSRGASGDLGAAGILDLTQIRLRLKNSFGSVLLSSLDDKPLEQSEKILVQYCTEAHLTGWETKPFTFNQAGQTYEGEQIVSIGVAPWAVEDADGYVVLLWSPNVVKAEQLDGNGYLAKDVSTRGSYALGGYRLNLPPDSLYTVLTIAPPASPTAPRIASLALPNGNRGTAYQAAVEVANGTPPLVWSAEGLPEGLAVDHNGVISGVPWEAGLRAVSITVTDALGQSATGQLRLAILPVPDNSVWTAAPLANGWRQTPLGWMFDALAPFYYDWDWGWLYAFPGAQAEAVYFYDFARLTFLYYAGQDRWYYRWESSSGSWEAVWKSNGP